MNDTGDTKGQSEGRGKGSGHKRCCGVCCLRGGVRGCCLHGWPTRMAGLGGIAARCPCHGLLPTLWPAAPKLSKKGGADRADCRGQKGRQGAQVALRSRRPRTAGPPSPPPLRVAGGLAGAHTNIQSGQRVGAAHLGDSGKLGRGILVARGRQAGGLGLHKQLVHSLQGGHKGWGSGAQIRVPAGVARASPIQPCGRMGDGSAARLLPCTAQDAPVRSGAGRAARSRCSG